MSSFAAVEWLEHTTRRPDGCDRPPEHAIDSEARWRPKPRSTADVRPQATWLERQRGLEVVAEDAIAMGEQSGRTPTDRGTAGIV